MTDEQLTLFPGRRCSSCLRHGVSNRIEVTPPDTMQQIVRFFCDTQCLVNWETNQPPKKAKD